MTQIQIDSIAHLYQGLVRCSDRGKRRRHLEKDRTSEADPEQGAADDGSETEGIRPYALAIIAGVLGIFGWGLYSFFGRHWWQVLLVLVAVPLLFWTLARGRDRYTRHISTKFDLSFSPGFPSIPPGSPAHGRTPWGFTGCTLSRREGRATLNLYEQSFSATRNKVYRAHGLWWQYDDPLFPEFEVRRRNLLTAMASAMVSVGDEIIFRDDPEFSARFTVRGTAEDQIRRLLTPQLRKALLEEVDQGIVGGKGHVLAWDRQGRLWGESALGKLILRAGRLRQAFEAAAQGIQ